MEPFGDRRITALRTAVDASIPFRLGLESAHDQLPDVGRTVWCLANRDGHHRTTPRGPSTIAAVTDGTSNTMLFSESTSAWVSYPGLACRTFTDRPGTDGVSNLFLSPSTLRTRVGYWALRPVVRLADLARYSIKPTPRRGQRRLCRRLSPFHQGLDQRMALPGIELLRVTVVYATYAGGTSNFGASAPVAVWQALDEKPAAR